MKKLNLTLLFLLLLFQIGQSEKSPQEPESDQKPAVLFYPNPAIDYITMHDDIEAGEIRIFDVLGREVMNFYYPGSGKIDLQHLHNGIYILKTGRYSGFIKKIKKGTWAGSF